MGSFFEELQEARRNGTAPPQVAEQEPPEVTYSPSPVPGAWSCGACFGLVDSRLTEMHTAWHIDTQTT